MRTALTKSHPTPASTHTLTHTHAYTHALQVYLHSHMQQHCWDAAGSNAPRRRGGSRDCVPPHQLQRVSWWVGEESGWGM